MNELDFDPKEFELDFLTAIYMMEGYDFQEAEELAREELRESE